MRLAIAVLHSLLGLSSLLSGSLVIAQAAANRAWETSFYGAVDPFTEVLNAAGIGAASLGGTQLLSAWLWFAGGRRSGFVLLLLGGLTLGAWPPAIAVLVLLAAWGIARDLVVR